MNFNTATGKNSQGEAFSIERMEDGTIYLTFRGKRAALLNDDSRISLGMELFYRTEGHVPSAGDAFECISMIGEVQGWG